MTRFKFPLMLTGVVFGLVAVWLFGSWLYWVGEDRPGTPDEFRQRVEAVGLPIAWTNYGPSGGDGFVTTDCGETAVMVNDIGDELLITWNAETSELTPDVVVRVLACSPSEGYAYFGSVQLARGASQEITVDGVDSAADLTVLESPNGVVVTISSTNDGPTLMVLEVADDAPLGAQVVTFDVAGEPEPLDWTFRIVQP